MSRREIFPLRTTETMKMIPDDQLQYVYRRNKEIQDLLRDFDRNHMRANYEPLVLLKNLSEILEEATAVFISNDPDPLDDRHPHRTHPDSALGNLLKTIFKNDDFMTSLVVSYILVRDNVELSIQGCRVLLACVPGLDSKVVFSEPDDFIPRLYHWAGPEGTNETLQGYAMGLLAAALENTENASKFRNENAELVPFALDRMRELQVRAYEEHNNLGNTDFSELNSQQKSSENGVPSTSNGFEIPSIQVTSNGEKENEKSVAVVPPPPKKRRTEPNLPALLRTETTQRVPSFHNLRNLDDSNSKWDILQPFLIGTQKVYPLSLPTYQRFILQYLAACGEYQDLLVQTFEGNALDLLLDYIDLEKTKDVRLTFDALKYLTSLLVHRKFALEFIEKDGIRTLLRLPRTSLASVGVVTCFYYIAYNNDVMEMLCQMGDDIVDETVQYVLWCLEHSHESGMASACMFFSQSLFFKAILRRFEQYDGPRKLFNYISTLVLMQCTENTVDLTEEQVHTSTQCVRSVCTTFRAYLLASMYTKVEFWKKQYNGAGAILPCGMRIPYVFQSEVPEFRSMKTYEEVSVDCEAIVAEMCRFTGMPFREAENMRKLGCVQMFLAVRVLSRDWLTISSNVRNDMCVYALESLRLMLCQPTIQTELITQHTYSHSTFDGFTILIQTSLARGDEEPPLRMAALECIRRCVLVEPESWKTLIQKMKEIGTTPSKRQTSKYETVMNHLERMWTEVRKADGIMSLVDLINLKTPLTEADSIRRLATNVLTGLARHPEVRQILSRLPLIAHGGLQILMREPVSSDKRDIHAGFCKEACQLLQVVAGKKIHFDHHAKEIRSSDKSHRQWVVENTPVSFNQVELLQLIHDHLIKNQLDNVASLLKTEAKLPDRPASRSNSTTSFLSKPLPSTGNNFSKIHDVFPTLAPRTLESEIGGISSAKRASTASLQSPIAFRSHSTDDDVFATPTLPRRYTTSGAFPRKLLISPARSRQRPVTPADDSQRPYCDLNSIVTNYFRTQHSTCQNPVTACPPFSLYYPHKCPERIQKTPITANFALRMLDQECLRPHQRTLSQWMNEREIFSKFRQIKVMHDNDESYTRAAFSTDDEHVIVGHFTGELHWLNAESGADESHTNCHGSAITNIQPSSDGSLILTSSAYSRPLSALWRLGHAMERIQMFREDSCVLFANTTMARIIGTNKEKAVVYDTETHHILDTYSSGTEGLQYDKNFASFSPDDRLVFNDGLLWDVRNKNAAIHAFDRLAKRTMWGTFHPQGTQIIINSEVYDIRTFRMLHHVPELARCKVKFNSTGNIAFAAEVHDLMRPDYPDLAYSPFRSFDTRDYSALTTVEGRRPIIDICVSHHDQKLCIVEQVKPQVNDYMVQSSTQMRMYESGRTKDIEDEEEEEEETREGHGGEEGGSSSSSDTDEEMGDDDDDAGSTVRDAFERIGRLGDESEDEIEEGEDGFDFENALNRIIRRQALLRRQRVNSSENGDAGVVDMNDEDDGDDEADDVDLDDDDDVDLDDHLEDEEDDVDPDFDVENAIDELVNAVDAEVDEDEMGEDDDSDDSDGSWRTASRVGSEDINLDELDEDQAREAENEGDVPEDVPPVNAAAQVEAARRAILGRGLRGLRMGMMGGGGRHRHHHRNPAMIHVEQLNARAEEQRLQFMEAIAREREPEENGENGEDESDMEQYQSEEEEINSVSTTVLNPALRRQNRRQQSPEGDS